MTLSKDQNRTFILLAAVCTFATVITNLIIHFTTFTSATFEENILLYKNVSYLSMNWIIMVHCLLILISMFGMALLLQRYSQPLAILAFIFFILFVFAEWERILNVLWYLNGLRAKYHLSTDDHQREWLKFEIQQSSYQSNVQFLLFILAFSLGNFFNGLILIFQSKWSRLLGIGLILWSIATSCAFIIDFYPSEMLAAIVNFSNKFYQPFMRLLVGIWLLDQYRKL